MNHRTYIDCIVGNGVAYGARAALDVRSFARSAIERKTYRELVDETLQLASVLAARFDPGSRAVLVFPTSWEFVEAFLACLAAGLTAVPAPHVRKLSPGNAAYQRLQSIIEDSKPAVVIHADDSDRMASFRESFPAVTFFELTDLSSARTDGAAPRPVDPASPAFIQYSSGSISRPKGVVVSHRNLMANQHQIKKVFRHDDDSHFVSWLPNYHDMGLVGGILQPLFLGTTCHLFPAEEFIQQPGRWFSLIEESHATTSGAPNFAYAHCLNRIKDDASFDLSRWRNAFNGAEPISAKVVREFIDTYARFGFRPDGMLTCYGLAEATLLVAGGHVGDDLALREFRKTGDEDGVRYQPCAGVEGAIELAPVGRLPLEDTTVRIVKRDASGAIEEAGEGEVGRLWVSSESIASAYWGKPEESAATFSNERPGDPARYLDTGDAAFHAGGELFIVGRSANKIIVRGANFYAEEIERQLAESMPSGCTSVTILQDPLQESVWMLVEIARSRRRDPAFAAAVSESLGQSMVRHFGVQPAEIRFVPEFSLPRTTSGKIQRSKCLDLARATPEES